MVFSVRRATAQSPDVVWRELADVAAHARHVPLTRVETDGTPPRLGWGFTMVTRLGPLPLLRDRMVLTEWAPPRRFRVVKIGRGLDGWAEVRVIPHTTGCEVVWTEEIGTRLPLTRRLSRVIGDRVGPGVFGRVVDALLAGRPDRTGADRAGADRVAHLRTAVTG